jgi:hypothetical protein
MSLSVNSHLTTWDELKGRANMTPFTYRMENLSDRLRLDSDAGKDGEEDARTDYREQAAVEGEVLQMKANATVEDLLQGDEYLTNDPQAFRDRYVDGYIHGYTEKLNEIRRWKGNPTE